MTYSNELTFDIPKVPLKIEISNVTPLTPNTKAVHYAISESTVDTHGLSYYAVYAKKDASFGAGVPDGRYLIDKVYSLGDPRGTYIPATAGYMP